MTDRELFEKALEALLSRSLGAERLITALRERLAQPEQEPVGRLESDPYEGHVFVPRIDGDWSMLGEDLYTAPPQRNPPTDEQERKHFEYWYSTNAFDYESHPIGSRECGLQWRAWIARAAHGIKGEA